MAEPVQKKATYDDLFKIPENMTGEIVNGELITTPRPSRRHVHAASVLELKLPLLISLEMAAVLVDGSYTTNLKSISVPKI